jgi:hypothetical protein
MVPGRTDHCCAARHGTNLPEFSQGFDHGDADTKGVVTRESRPAKGQP